MRAFMSDWAAHAEDGSRYVPGFNADAALREARIILSETEGSETSGRYSIGERATRPSLMPYHVALAEALQAFISE